MKKRCHRCDLPAPASAWACESCAGPAVLTPGSSAGGRWRVVRLRDVSPTGRWYEVRDREARGEALLVVRAPPPGGGDPQEQVRRAFPVTAAAHPSLAVALEGGVGADGCPWVAFEPSAGVTLREHLEREGALDVPAAADLLCRVASALAAMHQAGGIHGALDARSLRVEPGPRGVLKPVIHDGAPEGPEARPRPPADMAAGVAADLQALGALAWECLAGRPLREEGPRGRRAAPVPLTLLRPAPAVPPDLDDFVMRLLARDPDRQPAGAAEVAERLARWRRGGPVAGEAGPGAADPARGGPPAMDLREPAVAWRGAEMARLARALGEAGEGRGAVLWMEGGEGGGKTTLGKRFLDLAGERGFRAGAGRAAPGRLLSAWQEALQALGVAGGEGEEGLPDRPVEEMLGTVIREGPVALFLDDFHRADPPSADVLDRVARHLAVRTWPVLVLVASRPLGRSQDPGDPALHRALATVRELGGAWALSGMTDREIDAVVAGMSRRPLDADLRSLVRRTAAGNPMVAVQLLRHLSAEGALRLEEGRVVLAPGRPGPVPEGLRQVLAARLEGLRRQAGGLTAAEVLDRVALLGRHATPGNLQALLDLEGRSDLSLDLGASLARLVEEGYVREVPWRPEPFLVPVHAGLREALESEWQGVDAGRRHLAAARVLEAAAGADAPRVAADLADHYGRAGYLEAAVEWLRKAADRAVLEGDVGRAREMLARADRHLLRLGLPADRRRTAILLDLAGWEVFGGRVREAARLLSQVDRECPPEAGSRLSLHRLQASAALAEARRDVAAASGALERLWAEARRAGDDPLAARARMRTACLRMDQGDNQGARRALEEAESLLQGRDDPRLGGLLLLVRGRLARKSGPWAEAVRLLDEALGSLVDPRDLAERVEAMYFQAGCLMDRDRLEEAVEVHRTGVALSEQAGFPRGQAAHLGGLATCMGRLGHPDEAMAAARRALELRERMEDPRGLAGVLSTLAELANERRDFATARDLSEKALGLCRQVSYVPGERLALLNLARACSGLGNVPEARRGLEACLLTTRRDDSLSLSLAHAHLALADVLEASGERDAALRHRLGAVVVFERLERPDRADAVRRQLGAGAG